jgi:hypothetical protein
MSSHSKVPFSPASNRAYQHPDDLAFPPRLGKVKNSSAPNATISYINHRVQMLITFALLRVTLDKYLQPLFPIAFFPPL